MAAKHSLTTRIFLGLGLGIVFGLVLNRIPAGAIRDDWLCHGVLEIVGGLFINSIRMVVVPLVFLSLVSGAASLGEPARLGRIGGRALLYYLVTTAIAITLALGIALTIKPGSSLDLHELGESASIAAKPQRLVDTVKNLIPTNPIGAMAEGNMLQIIFFALLTGVAAALTPAAGPFLAFVNAANEVLMKMVILLMHLAPYGVFALIARTIAGIGLEAFEPLALYLIAVFISLLAHMFITYMGALWVLGRLSPIRFFRNFAPAMSVAFSTASSNGTLPISMETVELRCGVSKGITSFTMPLGATINMDGTAIMQGVAVVFIAQLYHIPLPLSALATVILTATLASIGTAGVPGVGMITLSMVLESVGLPVAGIAFILGIDRIVDMARTVVNITGDAVCTILVAQAEGEFDRAVFDSDNAGE
jgi:Na+/H+-dicarboxylate symporter